MKYPEDNLAKLNLFEDAHNLYLVNKLIWKETHTQPLLWQYTDKCNALPSSGYNKFCISHIGKLCTKKKYIHD